MIELFIRLILAHLLADFFLQPSAWVEDRAKNSYRSPSLYLHIGIHFALSCILVWRWDFIPYAFLLAAIHGLIDVFKTFGQKNYPIWAFYLDQILHVISIGFVYLLYTEQLANIMQFAGNISLIKLTAYLFVTFPASILIRISIGHWSPSTEPDDSISLKGLFYAGTWIGVLERVLVLTFILNNQWSAIGFLIAAKSVFRFGDLKELREFHLTEYILIGTLLSFGLAIFTGLLVLYCMKMGI